MTVGGHLVYALLWASFGAGHSLLAGATARRGIGRIVGRWHRVLYNVVAIVHAVSIYLIGRLVLARGDPGWGLYEATDWSLDVAAAVGVLTVVVAAGGYRLASFAGWAQISGEEEDGDQDLRGRASDPVEWRAL